MNNLFDFLFKGEKVLVIIDDYGKFWYNASDVSLILLYKTPSETIRKNIDNKNKIFYQHISTNAINKKFTLRYQPNSIFIDNSGLFRLCIKSRQKIAVEFQQWITDEVLPQLQEKGKYKLKKKIKIMENKNEILKQENNYLHIKQKYVPSKHGYVYITEIKTTVRGIKKICYKFGICDDLNRRFPSYKTGNPNVKLIFYVPLKTDMKIIENCVKAYLKLHDLKKNNEIKCFISLDEIKNVLETCIIGFNNHICNCILCKKEFAIGTLNQHQCKIKLDKINFVKVNESISKYMSKSRSKSRNKSRSESRSKPRNKSRSKSGSKSRNKSRSKSRSKPRNKSRSKSISKPRNKSGSKSRSKSRNKSRSKLRNKSRSKSISRHISKQKRKKIRK